MIEQLLQATYALLVGAFLFVAWGGHRLCAALLRDRFGWFSESQATREAEFLEAHEAAYRSHE